jgi:hypothetical protein
MSNLGDAITRKIVKSKEGVEQPKPDERSFTEKAKDYFSTKKDDKKTG